MQAQLKVLGQTQIPYYTKGDSPTLLIHSGTHGDEYGVIESVRLAVEKYENQLPDFIYVPVVSPSAVAKRTRENEAGLDLNRSFFGDSADSEIQANQEIVKGKNMDLVVTFHEDIFPEAKFYLYDVGLGLSEKDSWKKFKEELEVMGVGLLNGADDPDDPALNTPLPKAIISGACRWKAMKEVRLMPGRRETGSSKKHLFPKFPATYLRKRKIKLSTYFSASSS